MRIKSTDTTINYANRDLLTPGGYFDGDAISDTLETTAEAFESINSRYKNIEAHLNTHASRSFSFVVDFDGVEKAVQYKLAAEDHATLNPTGTLEITIGNTSRRYAAGLTSLTSNISLVSNAVRLVLTYSFMTGKCV